MGSPRITFVGGGGVNWTPHIVRDMLLVPELSGAEFRLLDLNLEAAELCRGLLVRLAEQLKVPATITAGNNVALLTEADYVIIAISTGGLDAMAHDLSLPEEYGIYHTVGDTSGPGGWARLIRNYRVFAHLAAKINELAPGAMVLNYTNPMTGLTDVLARRCRGPVVGLCHGLFENLEFLVRHFELPGENALSVNYGGLNHFFWINRILAGKRDLLQELKEDLETKSFGDLLTARQEPGAEPIYRDVATEMYHLTGLMPYLGDRHICEYFGCYITDPKNLEKYHVARTSISDRREQVAKRRAEVEEMAAGPFPETFLQGSRETAADIIRAHYTNTTFIDVGNVPNVGQISNLPRGLVVETAVRVDGSGFTPLTYGALHPVAASFIEPYARLLPMTVDACERGDRHLALRALRLDPVCGGLTTDAVFELGNRLLEAHRDFHVMPR